MSTINNIKQAVAAKEEYVKPQIEIIEIDNEGILASSDNTPSGAGGFGNGRGASSPGWHRLGWAIESGAAERPPLLVFYLCLFTHSLM